MRLVTATLHSLCTLQLALYAMLIVFTCAIDKDKVTYYIDSDLIPPSDIPCEKEAKQKSA